VDSPAFKFFIRFGEIMGIPNPYLCPKIVNMSHLASRMRDRSVGVGTLLVKDRDGSYCLSNHCSIAACMKFQGHVSQRTDSEVSSIAFPILHAGRKGDLICSSTKTVIGCKVCTIVSPASLILPHHLCRPGIVNAVLLFKGAEKST
jgi:hypothetical protein